MPEPQQLHVNVRLEDGSLWATVDEHPGVFATGDNLDELRESLQEGVALALAGPGEAPPTVTLAPVHPSRSRRPQEPNLCTPKRHQARRR